MALSYPFLPALWPRQLTHTPAPDGRTQSAIFSPTSLGSFVPGEAPAPWAPPLRVPGLEGPGFALERPGCSTSRGSDHFHLTQGPRLAQGS